MILMGLFRLVLLTWVALRLRLRLRLRCLLTMQQHVPDDLLSGQRTAMWDVFVCVCVRVCVCVCVRVCVCVWGAAWLSGYARVLGSQPTSCEFDSHLGLAVVTLSKSLYPHCSSVPSCKIGTWLWLGWQKGQKHQSH